MINSGDLEKVVALALCTSYIQGDKPLSLLLISDRPEAGKTEVVKRFTGTPRVGFATDVSGYGIKRDFAQKIIDGEIYHIVIPEFLQPLLRGKVSSTSFVTTLQALMEDGVMGLHTGFIKPLFFKPGDEIKTVGVIACMPRPYFTKQLSYEWLKMGFLSRWVVVTYSYDSETVDSILASIESGDYLQRTEKAIVLDGQTIPVEMPSDVSKCCRELSETIVKEAKEAGLAYGFRELKHIRSLVAANVIYDGIANGKDRTKATLEDFEEISRLGYLFNEQYNAVRQ